MQSHYPEVFDRDMACTEAEWLAWLPKAVGEFAWQRAGSSVRVQLGQGQLEIEWQALPPRVIALMRLPRLQMRFRFSGGDSALRTRFMRHFDLITQRGGG